MYVLTELGYALICQVKEKEKICSFENDLVEKSKSSTRNKNGSVEGLSLFSIFKVTSVPFFIPELNLLSCEFDNFMLKVLY